MSDVLLPYASVRSQIQNGDAFLLEPTSNPFDGARIIAWWDRSRFSHVAMAVWLEDRLFCLEAKDGLCVRLYLLSDYLLYGRKVHWFKLMPPGEYSQWPTAFRDRMVTFAMGQLGRNYIPYWRMILDFLMLGRPKARTMLRSRPSLPVWFCSDLYAATAQAGGATLPDGITPYHTNPEEVAEFPFLTEMGLLVP